MAGWHHRCDGLELGQTLGDDEEQGGLVYHSLWYCKELDMTRWLKNNIFLSPFSIFLLLSFELIILLIIKFLFYISLYVIYATILYDYIRNFIMHM